MHQNIALTFYGLNSFFRRFSGRDAHRRDAHRRDAHRRDAHRRDAHRRDVDRRDVLIPP